jgi:2-keto-4-pentenoate hydratase/2-oxohepta-3-ene-1,7-dioic acid hydratase in catechol pathway
VRIARYEHSGHPQIGIIRHGLVNVIQGAREVLDILNLPRPERDALAAAAGRHQRVPIDEVRFLPPVEPRAMRDFVAFEAHISGMKKSEGGDGSVPEAWYEAPAFLFMNPWSLIGATDDLPMPPGTEALDFELEVAAIVGKPARDVSPDNAGDFIAGYTILNDWSARDIQRREMTVGLGPSKGKDFASTLGPWITTPDELEKYRTGDRLDLPMTVSVNGVEIGADSTKNLSWSFEELLSHASRGALVGAGDVIATGTCASGALSEAWSRSGTRTPPPLAVGDVVTMAVEGLGTISNRVTETTSPGIRVPRARRTYSEDRL